MLDPSALSLLRSHLRDFYFPIVVVAKQNAVHFTFSCREEKTRFQCGSRFRVLSVVNWSICQFRTVARGGVGKVKENNGFAVKWRKEEIRRNYRKWNWEDSKQQTPTKVSREMNVINSVVLTASSISSMVPLIGLIIFVGGILVLLVKWVTKLQAGGRFETTENDFGHSKINDRHISMNM